MSAACICIQVLSKQYFLEKIFSYIYSCKALHINILEYLPLNIKKILPSSAMDEEYVWI